VRYSPWCKLFWGKQGRLGLGKERADDVEDRGILVSMLLPLRGQPRFGISRTLRPLFIGRRQGSVNLGSLCCLVNREAAASQHENAPTPLFA
jgi:hypothetical protein